MRSRMLLSLAAFLILSATPVGAQQKAPSATALAKEGMALYGQGACAAALKKLDAAIAAGSQDPEVFYVDGICYRQALNNTSKERELWNRAAPLLESRVRTGGTLADHYYLASIDIESLGMKSKGVDVARKGIELAGASKGAIPKTPMDHYMLGRLYGFADDTAHAEQHFNDYVKLADKPGAGKNTEFYKSALQSIASYRMAAKDYAGAAKAFGSILAVAPEDDQIRNVAARSLLLAGEPMQAATVWRGAHGDDMRTEFMYMANIATRYAQAGSPTTSKIAPDASSLSEEDLVAKIREAGQAFAKVRTAYMTEKKAKEDAARAKIDEKLAAKKALSPEEIKARVQARKKEMQAELAKSPNTAADPNEPVWKKMEELNQEEMTSEIDFPEPPEMKAAAKDFYYLMTEYVKRGHMLRDFSFQYGLMDLIFR